MENPKLAAGVPAEPTSACPTRRRSFLAVFLGGILGVFPLLTGSQFFVTLDA